MFDPSGSAIEFEGRAADREANTFVENDETSVPEALPPSRFVS